MPAPILHHYPNSPFAEKIRLVFGLKNLAWHSCDVSPIMPKPELQALTGGYRRVPVLQMGADIYCDTLLICEVLESLKPTPSLYPQGQTGLARTLAQWADGTLFGTAMAYNFSPAGGAEFARLNPGLDLKAFAADRAAMRGGAARMYPGDAAAAYKSYLRRIATMLESSQFVLGEQLSVADLAIYHALWFTRRLPAIAGVLATHAAILPWMDRVAALGHGARHSTELTRAESLVIARQATPAVLSSSDVFQDEHGIALGTEVTITAESFGLEVTSGTLVAATRTRFTLARTHELTGVVHVHFPRIGFVLKKAEH
ncbi:MAG: glutathione S-transferase family protein [Cytophagales bacterium]|nr:glutathione S-transferase family protein [Cytophagales bacterium]